MTVKKCTKCGVVRPLGMFAKCGRGEALKAACKICTAAARRLRYSTNPEVAKKAKANSKRWATKRFDSADHRELWRAQKRRHRWRHGAIPAHEKHAQRLERDALALSINNARQAWRHWIEVKASDEWMREYFTESSRPWLNPRLSESEKLVLRYRFDDRFHAREYARLQRRKRERRRQESALRTDLTHAVEVRIRGQASVCAYCGAQLTAVTRTLDHKIPLSRGGLHAIANVVPCCRSCNAKKQDRLAT